MELYGENNLFTYPKGYTVYTGQKKKKKKKKKKHE